MKQYASTALFWLGVGFSKVLELPVPARWEWWGSFWYRPYNWCIGWSYRLDPSEWSEYSEEKTSNG